MGLLLDGLAPGLDEVAELLGDRLGLLERGDVALLGRAPMLPANEPLIFMAERFGPVALGVA